MNTGDIREQSLRAAVRLGYRVLPTLPLLEPKTLRSQVEILTRALSLNAALATSWGFPRDQGLRWAQGEGLSHGFTEAESAFLRTGERPELLRLQVESLWVLVWSLGFIAELDFRRVCGEERVAVFPNLKQNESSAAFRARALLRSPDEICTALDLAYCLYWAIRQAEIDAQKVPGHVPAYVVIERRRALEWLCGEDDWDNMPLDT